MRTTVNVPITADSFPDKVYVPHPTNPYGKGKWMAATSVERGPLLANARTGTLAKVSFGDLVGKLLDTYCEPRIVTFKGYVGVCHQTANLEVSFAYQLVFPDGRVAGGSRGYDTLASAERHARSHISQNAVDYFDDSSVRECFEWLLVDQRDDFLRDVAWQRCYRLAPAGVPDVHRWTCEAWEKRSEITSELASLMVTSLDACSA